MFAALLQGWHMARSRRFMRESSNRQKYKESAVLVVGRQLYTIIHKLDNDDETRLNVYGYDD
jgi:hypothetical protein